MVAAGLLDTSKEHAQAVTNMAFGMREEAGKVIEPVNNQPIQVSIALIYVRVYCVLQRHCTRLAKYMCKGGLT